MSKNKNSKRKHKSIAQQKLSSILRRTANVSEVRLRFFAGLSAGELRESLKTIANSPVIRPLVNMTLRGKSNSCYVKKIPDLPLDKSVAWAVGIIQHHEERVNKFLDLELRLTEEILKNRLCGSLKILDEIDQLCGISTWSVGIRCSVLKLNGKNELSQEFYTDICEASTDNGFFTSICKLLSDRFDDSAMFMSRSSTLRTQVSRNFTGDLRSFLTYKVSPRNYTLDSLLDFKGVFNYELNSSLVDTYKVVESFLSFSVFTENESIKAIALESAKKLDLIINSEVIRGVAAYYGQKQPWFHGKAEYELVDKYSAGRYKEICNEARENDKNFYNFTLFELVTKSAIRERVSVFNGFEGDISSYLVDVILKKDGYKKSLSQLLVLCHSFSGIPWFQELSFLVSRESAFMGENIESNLNALSSIYSTTNSPKKIQILPINLRQHYFDSCKNAIPDSLTIKLFESLITGVKKLEESFHKAVDERRLKKYEAMIYRNNDDHLEAIDILEDLISSDDELVSYDSKKLLLDSYIKTYQNEKALELFVDTVLENPNTILLFNIHKVCQLAKEMIKESNSVCISIALSLYSSHFDQEYDAALKYSFDKFLKNNSLKKPLDVLSIMNSKNEKKYHFFLEHVCVPETMTLSLIFDNKTEIETCRIEICTYLIEQKISKKSLVDEVKELTNSQVIKQASHQVDQNKICADLSSLKSRKQYLVKEVFDRYCELSTNDYSKLKDEITLKELSEILYEKDIEDRVDVFLSYPLNEKNNTFMNLASVIRDEFTFGDKGLNSYLSTGIRHGYLPNKLRATVFSEELATSWDSDAEMYKDNTFWKGKLDIPNKEKDKINSLLKVFTKDFNELLNEINDQWLKITSLDLDMKELQKNDTKNKSLFDYTISHIDIYRIQQSLENDSYDNCLKIVTDWLWKKTDQNLISVREKLSSEAKTRFQEIYSKLSSELNKTVSIPNKVAKLQDAINRSKDGLNAALDVISGWFTRSEVNLIENFDFDTAIEIASKSNGVQLEKKEIQDELVFKGQYLKPFVDILYILFENAVTKSNLPKDKLELSIFCNLEKSNLIIKVTNKCAVTDIDEENEKLEVHRERLKGENLPSNIVQGEGGSGFLKIQTTLTNDIEIAHYIEFSHDDDSVFRVKIKLESDSKELLYENSSC